MLNRYWLLVAGALAVLLTGEAVAQDYIYKPGPRGFDSRRNPYGTTEKRSLPKSVTAAPTSSASQSDQRFDPARTTLRIELIMPQRGGSLAAQRWSRLLSEMGYSVRTHSALLGQQPDIQESNRGTLRTVTVIGRLGPDGELHFPQRSFALRQAKALREWLAELKMYGAQGSPAGKPLWGLELDKFKQVYTALGTIARQNTAGLPLKSAIARLGIPAEYPVSFSTEAKRQLRTDQGQVTVGNVAGLSVGTALAYLLSERGLGFHPARTPSGRIELLVEPRPMNPPNKLADDAAVPRFWPIGWEIEEAESPEENASQLPLQMRLAPKYFKLSRFGFHDATLREAFDQSTKTTGVRVFVSVPGLARSGVDLDQKRISLDSGYHSWNLAMKRITALAGLRSHLRRDENGNPLMWVTAIPGTK